MKFLPFWLSAPSQNQLPSNPFVYLEDLRGFYLVRFPPALSEIKVDSISSIGIKAMNYRAILRYSCIDFFLIIRVQGDPLVHVFFFQSRNFLENLASS